MMNEAMRDQARTLMRTLDNWPLSHEIRQLIDLFKFEFQHEMPQKMVLGEVTIRDVNKFDQKIKDLEIYGAKMVDLMELRAHSSYVRMVLERK